VPASATPASPAHRPTATRRTVGLLDAAIVICLWATVAAAIYGHWGGNSTGLSLNRSYVTEYIKQAPHWPWLVVAAFCFALLLQLLALGFLRRPTRSWLLHVGCLLLATSSMATFFAVYSPVRRVTQPPPPDRAWWTPSWWFTSRTARSPYDHGLADAYSDVHYRATRLVVVTVVAGVLCLGLGHLAESHGRRFALQSIAAAGVMSLFFFMGDRLDSHRGLWQRIGFSQLVVWLWLARKATRHPTR